MKVKKLSGVPPGGRVVVQKWVYGGGVKGVSATHPIQKKKMNVFCFCFCFFVLFFYSKLICYVYHCILRNFYHGPSENRMFLRILRSKINFSNFSSFIPFLCI